MQMRRTREDNFVGADRYLPHDDLKHVLAWIVQGVEFPWVPGHDIGECDLDDALSIGHARHVESAGTGTGDEHCCRAVCKERRPPRDALRKLVVEVKTPQR